MAETPEAPKPPLCFVIGPISKDGTLERKHADLLLHSVIKHVLEANEFGYKVKRADEDVDPGMIGDRVISDIIHAELVVADLTELNPNAFYELGIRHSTEQPTIHVAKTGTILPFDNAGHHTIFMDLTDWHSTEAGRARLAAFARAIKEPVYKVSNPITQANASFKMRQSADPQERVIAQLQARISALELKSRPVRRNQISDPIIILVECLITLNLDKGAPDRVVELVNDELSTFKEKYELHTLSTSDQVLQFALFRSDESIPIHTYLFPA